MSFSMSIQGDKMTRIFGLLTIAVLAVPAQVVDKH